MTASGDKLLGGPQCGIMLGRADLVHRLRRHPVARAFRVDKLTLAALEATLRGPLPPVHRALDSDVGDLRRRAEDIARRLDAMGTSAQAVESTAAVGGGGAPGVDLASAAVALPVSLAEALRRGDPAVMGRVERDRLLLDLIAIDPDDDATLLRAVQVAVTASAAR